MEKTISITPDSAPSPLGRLPQRVDRRADWLWAGLAMLITLAVFSPVLHHHFIEAWDDSTAILTNPDYNPPGLHKLGHYWAIPPHSPFYVPITYSLWGLLAMVASHGAPKGLPFNPAFFYAANWIAHALSAGFAFLCLGRLIKSRWAAFVGAAVFALHPIQVEGVANAWSVYTPLSGMFALAALWQYLIFSEQTFGLGAKGDLAPLSSARIGARWRYGLATLLFVAGLLAKPQIVTLPVIAAAIEVGLRRRKPRELLALVPWLALALLDVWVNRVSSPSVGAYVPQPWLLPLVPLDAIAFHLWTLVWPLHLTLDYGRSPVWLVDHPEVWWTCLAPLILGAAAWSVRKRLPWIATAGAVFVAGLLPTLGLMAFDFQHYSTVADRFTYLAMFGPGLAAAFVVQRLGARHWAATATAAIVGLLILAALSIRQLRYWQNDWTLAAHMLDANPQSSGAIASFRYLYTPWGHYDTIAAPFPAPHQCTLDRPTLLRVGDALRKWRYFDLAADNYTQALAAGPPSAFVYDRLGATRALAEEPERAIKAYRRALQLDASDSATRAGLAQVLLRQALTADAQGHATEAMAYFRQVLQLDPANTVAKAGMAPRSNTQATRPATSPPAMKVRPSH